MMSPAARHRVRTRRGSAYVLALILMTMFVSLSLAMTTSSNLEMIKSRSAASVFQARANAEAGMAFMVDRISSISLPSDVDEDSLPDELKTFLAGKLNGTSNLAGGTVTIANDVITVPAIDMPSGSFSATVSFTGTADDLSTVVTTTGVANGIDRKISISFALASRRSAVFDYGIASKGKITLKGSGIVTGSEDPNEAKVLSTRGSSPAISVSGSATVGGELYATGNADNYIDLGNGGGYSVAGLSDTNEIRDSATHVGVDEPEFPEIDTSPFPGMTTEVIDSSTKTKGSAKSWDNVVIKAGTNPSFQNTQVINGVMYIESPNKVRFAGQVTLNGIIVTEEPTIEDLSNNVITFRGGFEAPGVEALPNTDAFSAIKRHTGTSILAPGFKLDFKGNTSTVNGVIAADQLEFSGNSSVGGSLEGMILGLGDHEMTITGSSEIKVNPPSGDSAPAGFKHKRTLQLVPTSYTEPTH